MAEGRYLRDVLTILSPQPIEEESSSQCLPNIQEETDSTKDANRNKNDGPISTTYIQYGNNGKEKKETCEQFKLKQRLQDLKRQNEEIQRRKQETLESYAKFLNQYEYGLNSIKKLNDLMDAPDNIMNGNQTKEALG